MKTNLDATFKTNEEEEKTGIWFMISDETGFMVRRFGGANKKRVKKAMAKYYKPYARQVETETISEEKEQEILVNAFIDASLVDWKGVDIDGQLAECTRENAQKLFLGLPELFQSIYDYASATSTWKEDLGNS